MGFFEVGDGDGGTVTDRVAIVAIVGFAFSWIPVMIIWKIITVCKAGNRDVEKGNMPVTTHASNPKDHPQPDFDQFPVEIPENQPQPPEQDLSASAHIEAEHQTSDPTNFAIVGSEKNDVEKSNRQHRDDRQFDDFSFSQTQESRGILDGSHATHVAHDPYREDASQPGRASRRHRSRRDRDDKHVDEAEKSYASRRPSSAHSRTSKSHRSRRAEREMNDHYPTDPLRTQHTSSRHPSQRHHDDEHQHEQNECRNEEGLEPKYF